MIMSHLLKISPLSHHLKTTCTVLCLKTTWTTICSTSKLCSSLAFITHIMRDCLRTSLFEKFYWERFFSKLALSELIKSKDDKTKRKESSLPLWNWSIFLEIYLSSLYFFLKGCWYNLRRSQNRIFEEKEVQFDLDFRFSFILFNICWRLLKRLTFWIKFCPKSG